MYEKITSILAGYFLYAAIKIKGVIINEE